MNPFAASKLLIATAQASAQTIARQLRRQRPIQMNPTYPIVLMHGLAGFREVSIGNIKLFDYFNGVEIMLKQMGYRTFAPQVPFFAKPQDRASAWFHEIEKVRRDTDADKVHLIGHSQGGLDARVLIAANKPAQDTPLGPLMGLGYGDHVASLVSLGTPHLGSVMVDMFNEGDPDNAAILNAVSDLISVIARVFSGDPQDARGVIQAIGRKYMLDYFNPIIEDNPQVPCYTIAGDPETAKLTSPLLTTSYKQLLKIPAIEGGGANDGLVTLQSGFFGCPPAGENMDFDFCDKEHPRPHWQPLGIIQADHIEMVGIPLQLFGPDVYDHLAAFAGLAQMLDPNYHMQMKLEKNGCWTRQPQASKKPAARRQPGQTVKAKTTARKSGKKTPVS
jgi:triacylglycerol lipase